MGAPRRASDGSESSEGEKEGRRAAGGAAEGAGEEGEEVRALREDAAELPRRRLDPAARGPQPRREVAEVRDVAAQEGDLAEAPEVAARGEPVQLHDRQEPGDPAAPSAEEVQPGDEGG